MQETAIVQRPVMDAPLVTAEDAKRMWREYQDLEEAILTDDDYLWFVEYEFFRDNRRRVGRVTCRNRAQALAEQDKRQGSTISKRKVKAACRKMGKFFALEIPDAGNGAIETLHEDEFMVQIERGDFYTITEWLGKLPDRNGEVQQLRTIKSSAVVFVRSPSGRTWMGKGGAHYTEGFEDFAVSETAFTRAVNRAVLDFVGYGDESAEDTPFSEPIHDEQPPKKQDTATQEEKPYSDRQMQAARKRVTDKQAEKQITDEFMRSYYQLQHHRNELAELNMDQLKATYEYLDSLERQGSGTNPPEPVPGTEPPVDLTEPEPATEPSPGQQTLLDGTPAPEQPGDVPLTREQQIEAINSYAETLGFDPVHLPIILKMTVEEWVDAGKPLDEAQDAIQEMADRREANLGKAE